MIVLRLYDETPDTFKSTLVVPHRNAVPSQLSAFESPAPEDPTTKTGLYQYLDSNVGAAAMDFTYASIPKINSALSVRRFGHANPTRPWKVVADYLEDMFAKHIYRIIFDVTVERVPKNTKTGKWDIVLRQSNHRFKGKDRDYWWLELRFGRRSHRSLQCTLHP